ncbi:MAG: DUF58 domain-containing protein [Bdellovibrionales bacterium]
MAAAETQRLKRIYIVPTMHGVAFLGLIVVVILVGAASGNNLVYGLAFTLFAVYMLSMISTNANLKSLDFELLESEDSHAGETGNLSLVLINNSRKARFLVRGKLRRGSTNKLGALVQELPSDSRSVLRIPLRFEKRGVYDLPILQFSTVYPMGLFSAWANIRPQGKYFVYPKRAGGMTLETGRQGVGGAGQGGRGRETQHEDFREHSRYQVGESQHQVDWKVFARHGEMLSKRYDNSVPHHFILSWQQVAHLPREEGLSQLAQWVADLRQSENSFELHLPSGHVGRGRGHHHGQHCLRELARWPEEAAA